MLVWEAVHTAWAFRIQRGVLLARPLLQWRKFTAYGRGDVAMDTSDLIAFLSWRREFRRFTGAGS